MRSVFQISLYVVFVVTTGGASLAAPPNVIVFYTDDMGSGDLSCYGATDIATPNIDALAAFEQDPETKVIV
ncbi:MAG TPA: hypothetical protein PK458_19215, partial [Phycisphaerae bacterium]|nr:hypothetical protein [Phycisphaerae bacterium]